MIRGHAAWAPGRIPDALSIDALPARLLIEEDAWMISEISLDEG